MKTISNKLAPINAVARQLRQSTVTAVCAPNTLFVVVDRFEVPLIKRVRVIYNRYAETRCAVRLAQRSNARGTANVLRRRRADIGGRLSTRTDID